MKHLYRVVEPRFHLAELASLLEVQEAVFLHFYCENQAGHGDQAMHLDLHQLVVSDKLIKQLDRHQHRAIYKSVLVPQPAQPLENFLALLDRDAVFLIHFGDVSVIKAVLDDVFVKVSLDRRSQGLDRVLSARVIAEGESAELTRVISQVLLYVFHQGYMLLSYKIFAHFRILIY